MVSNSQRAQSSPAQQNLSTVKCPNCGHHGMQTFYEVSDIPVHSVLLMETREKAKEYPRRDLRLGFCCVCGFVCNTLFDPGVHEYSTSYEEPQTFSPTFNWFARNLAERWVKQYGLRGKTVLEIGCGKGEFLRLMVELGAGKGIGVDPAFVPNRLELPEEGQLEFIQDFYGEKYSHLEADAICCRHTLELIAPTGEFMRSLRRTIGDRNDIVLLFEVPDVRRVLKEIAFWDIYYEHCSYFTTESLRRLFEQNGFGVLESSVEYDDQYLIMTAKPDSMAASASSQPVSGSIEKAVGEFGPRFDQVKNYWLGLLGDFRSQNKRVVVWGGGSKAVSFITTLGLTDEIDFVVDVNPYKHGKFLPGSGHAVYDPRILAEHRPDVVVLMNRVYTDEVRSMLNNMGTNPQILAPDNGIDNALAADGLQPEPASRISEKIPSPLS